MLLPSKCKGPAASGYAHQTAEHCSRNILSLQFVLATPCHNSKLQARASSIWPFKKQCNAEHCE